MIFGAGRQISSLQEKIRELEAERNLLSNQVEQAHAEQSQLEEKNSFVAQTNPRIGESLFGAK